MVEKYEYGSPVNTQAVVEEIPLQSGEPFFGRILPGEGFGYICPLEKQDVVYGLGENVRGLNKRGWIYTHYNKDDPAHTEGKHGLYAAHNFLLISGRRHIGLFFDYPGEISFDVGASREKELSVSAPQADIVLYLIEEASDREVVKTFRRLIGKSYIPPKWGLGFQQSRWGYRTAQDVREVVKKHKEAGVPLDIVCLDIDYMDGCRDFTVSSERFPDFPAFVQEMREQGVRLLPIIDAGIKAQEGWEVYEEGRKKGYFCRKKNGEEYIFGVWPGKSVLVDVFDQEAAKWFGEQYGFLISQGIEGCWNDMNEPAMFWSLDAVKELWEKVPPEEYAKEEKLTSSFARLQSGIQRFQDNPSDHDRFVHHYEGRTYTHRQLHNLYGYFMMKAAREGFEKGMPGKTPLLYSRSSYIGMHRLSGVWTGDNCSWWSHLLLNIQMMPALNMCGFLYAGADIGGFGDDCTQDLMLRWLSFGIFVPLMRNHCHLDYKPQEFYQFEKKEEYRELIRLRYRLIPFLYREMISAAENNDVLFAPLSFDFPEDEMARSVDDQLLLGDSLMLAPIYVQNAPGRYVYLPEDMLFVKCLDSTHFETETMKKGIVYIKAKEHQAFFFVRKGQEKKIGEVFTELSIGS